MRFFNTTGPVVAADHYCVPPLERLNLEELLTLVRDKRYFVLHAPRQTGKTSALLALQDLLNSGTAGAYRCVYTNVETAQAMRDDVLGALRAILGQLGSRARRTLGENFLGDVCPGILETFGPAGALQEDEQSTAWYVDSDGKLNVVALLGAFQQFFRAHSEHWLQRFEYQEAGPQLLLQAFLQRIVNGGGRIEREYGLGRGRTDILIVWPRAVQTDRFVVECKILRNSLARTVQDGLEQTAAYMDRCAAQEGHLVIFDRRAGRWEDKVFHRTESAGQGDIHVWGM